MTLEFLKAQFRSRVTKGLSRISVRSLADDLDVDPDLVLQLVRTHSGVALLSTDNSCIVTIDERDALLRNLSNGLSSGIVQKSQFASEADLDENSVNALLKDVEGEVVLDDGHVFSKAYEQKVSDDIAESLQSSHPDLSPVDIKLGNLPGAPPLWFALRVLRDVLDSCALTDLYFIKEGPDGAQCYPKQLIEQNRDAVVEDLSSGKLTFVDLVAFQRDFPEFYSTVSDASQHIQSAVEVDIIDAFAISKAKRLHVAKACTESLAGEGRVDLAHVLNDFPKSLGSRLLPEIAHDINTAYQDEHGALAVRVGDFLLKPESYESERRVLLDYADVEAGLQWQQLQEHPEREVKYNLSNIVGLITKEQLILSNLIKEKAVEKAVEERFWTSISQQEAQMEAQFSKFWTERVQSKCQVYNDGLDKVADEKLRGQLSEILTTYAKKELIPESTTKARSQGLILSRKTRKNISAVEEFLKQDDSGLAGVFAALKKFHRKQGIETLANEKTLEAKQSIVNDLIRRMQKQKKSDGPVLFLTLVLVLFAKYNDGVVYATGKFAPKLLKQLKSVLPVEQYEQMEKWKEAAKTSSLTAEDRVAMKSMAEA